ncbi:hypothetical protein F2Q69_00007093 [Brassica cretica]|uniref:Uncharacterized protein n=1 Tax=Brassica cretica TaxID=69181 RepID=A0A8S9P3U4_BRACR|nr:hypothetical protein F2Q69_00007093 [Brassica cretica]
MEEMRQDLARIQKQCAAEATAPASIDIHLSTSIDDDLTHSNLMKSQPDSYTRAEIDQLVEDIYRTLETAEERLDRRCDDIYFPMDLTMNSLTSQIEAIHREIVDIQRYIARRPEASTSIDRRHNISTDKRRRTSIDRATNRGRLVPKMISDMSDTNNHREEISDDAYATLIRNQFQLESLGERLQKIENETTTMKEKWRRGDEAMRDFPESVYYIYKIRSDLEISDDFGAFWRYLEQEPEMTIKLDHRSILRNKYRSMFTSEHRSTAKRAKSPFGHSDFKPKSSPIYKITPDKYMPISTRSNMETQLLLSPDPASLERSIRKEARSSSIDNNARSSLDSRQPPSTHALVPSTDTRSPPSTKDTHLPSTDIFHPTSIDTSIRTSIDT